jgi:hypothetical protein
VTQEALTTYRFGNRHDEYMPRRPEDLPEVERPEPFVSPDAADEVSLDSEIDFDDEQEEDQAPLDVVEARELGVDLDDPEKLDPDS